MARVLIIDDDEHITRLLATHLSEEGYEVKVAHRAADGIAEAAKATPDLILLDVMLPDATGYQMCNRFRQAANTHATPIIMITGVAQFPNQQMFGLERGANEYILKPFKLFELGGLVHSYIGTEDQKKKSKAQIHTAPTPKPSSKGAAVKPGTAKDAADDPSADGLTELRSLLAKAISKSKKTH